MGRKPIITKDRLLDVAEELVLADGAKALTIDALSKAAGVSKGGVQYSFASKDELVRALVARWTSQFDAMLDVEDGTPPARLVLRYLDAMRVSQQAMNAKMAGLMIGYLQNPENMREARQWYRGIFAKLAGETPDAAAARVAFLAIEGLFLMRISGIDDEGAWTIFLDDVEAVLKQLVEQ